MKPLQRAPIDITLIDVTDNKLIRSSSSSRFLALSYVWGKASGLQTTTKNRANLEQTGGLLREYQHIPTVIQDAILFTRDLNERFLWVDCLCTEQDNPLQKHSQISHMHIIYSQALLTLVALSAYDAMSPLPGVRQGTRLRTEASVVIDDVRFSITPPDFEEAFPMSQYETRAWTPQERLLSERCLFFTDHAVYHYCHSTLREETRVNQSTTSQSINFILRSLDLDYHNSRELSWGLVEQGNSRPLQMADFQVYATLITLYSARELSFSSDILNALSALLAVLRDTLQHPFVSGLPSSLLPLTLLWIPAQKSSVPRRRNNHCSSWSWAGWNGPSLYFEGPLALCLDQYIKGRYFLRSAVKQFEISTQTPRRIVHTVQDFASPQPTSEEQHKPQIEPIPIARELLHFWSETACAAQYRFASSTRTLESPFRESSFNGVRLVSANPLMILDSESQHCGILYESRLAGFQLDRDWKTYDFVLLSACHPCCVEDGGCMHALDTGCELFVNGESVLDLERFPVYPWCLLNVMLIQWDGDRAERVAIGQVHKRAWEKAQRQKKDIT